MIHAMVGFWAFGVVVMLCLYCWRVALPLAFIAVLIGAMMAWG